MCNALEEFLCFLCCLSVSESDNGRVDVLLEEFFGKVNAGGAVASLAAEYDAKITPLLNP